MRVELVSKTLPLIDNVNTEEFAAYIARIGKVKENPEKLLKYLIKHKHWSPFEHSYFTFKIETSRAIGRELLRHRSFTFQELSQRYEKVLEFEPIELRREHPTNRQSSTEAFNPVIGDKLDTTGYGLVNQCLIEIKVAYEKLIDAGVAKECARFILPECTRTTMLMTGNVRSWIHFLAIRDDEHAQKEIQLVAKEIKDFLLKELPNCLENN